MPTPPARPTPNEPPTQGAFQEVVEELDGGGELPGGAPGASPGDARRAGEPDVRDDEAERLRAEVRELQEQALRRAAEFQNYRRRTDAELGQAAQRGREEVVASLLDVFDDLRRSIDAAGRASKQEGESGEAAASPAFDALRQGVELVYRKFSDGLARLGVEPIAAVGEPFDEAVHEALLQQPAPDPATPSGTVLAEVQPGYRLGDRVLRHARVIVAR